LFFTVRYYVPHSPSLTTPPRCGPLWSTWRQSHPGMRWRENLWQYPSRASYQTTSHELPPDSKSPLSLGIGSHEVTSLGRLGRMLFQWASWPTPLCVSVLVTPTCSIIQRANEDNQTDWAATPSQRRRRAAQGPSPYKV